MVRNKKKKYPQIFKSLSQFWKLCPTAMKVSHLNNMGLFTMNDQCFIPVKVMVQKIGNSVDFIFIIVAIPQNFLQIFSYYNFRVYNLLILRYSSILSSCNSKIIIVKNLQKFWGIAAIIRIKSTEFQIFWTITLAEIKNWSFNAKNPMLFRWET